MTDPTAINHAERVHGPLGGPHIEPPKRNFYVRLKRAACFNVLWREEQDILVRIQATTGLGTLRIAQYHYGSLGNKNFRLETRPPLREERHEVIFAGIALPSPQDEDRATDR